MTTSNLSLRPYDPRNATEAEYEALHAFYVITNREEHPHDPPDPLDLFVAIRRHGADFFRPAGFALWQGGTIVALAEAWTIETGENAHMAEFYIAVLPAHRRRGLARRLMACVAGVAGERGRRLLLGRTVSTIPAGEAFMQRLGARPGLPAHTNQLGLADLDQSLVRRWTEQGERLAGDFELGWWLGPYPEADLEAIAGLWRVMNQAPRGELDVEDFNFTPAQLREMDAAMQARGTERWSVYARERASGRLAGYSEVFWNPKRAYFMYQGNTGVFPEFRNRGLGRWLKAAMLERVLRERPEVQFVRTDNADVNAPMLKINTELGYQPYQAQTFWQVEVERVRAYLDEGAEAPETAGSPWARLQRW
jgi:GNAT superfamily N-acetyltransferase